ncbi:MAG TPA: efflux RND transporter periplasmic adaptor subunit [Polyangiaceae bacterium LLY-WYZ-15_(1-7)]|nr:efflux transporter periplasmic adaptor subunit [Sandaracinus sp.]HJL01063.1 efflux RND transporter periplasmic adaptor subunit [Polyangiaceae bacterium LLY-WYZ-15_(1-7)]HJL12095.1 efflux RND transporter periplasmic adaptor subunit [Polyangiaceae bacterium LLY-WYZ-15_(1-7)]HJL21245.1 efflux RND transporter periplasmic adaptor subunit [Polyangiaceae bacterium LLY-WYZ-15_(1-7)]
MSTDVARPGALARLRRLALPLVVVLGLGGGLTWWLLSRDAERSAPIETVRVERGSIRETAEATGHVEPHVQVEVKSEIAGEIVEVLAREGVTVEQGEVLFRVDRRDAERSLEDARVALQRSRAELAQARANLAVARAQAEEADAARDLAARSTERGLLSAEANRTAASNAAVARATQLQRRAAVQAGVASVAAARLAVQDAEQRLSETEIVAPIAGTVLDVAVEVGSIVASATANLSGGEPLATLADLSDLRVIGEIDEAQIARVEPGQRVEIRVDAYPDRVFAGRVERVAPLGVEEASVVSFEVEIVVVDEEAARLRSGMSADLSILTGEVEGVLVPLVAVRSEGGERVVQLASGEVRAIRAGATDGRSLVVLDGLEAGDEVRITPLASGAAASGQRGGNPFMPGPGRRGRR